MSMNWLSIGIPTSGEANNGYHRFDAVTRLGDGLRKQGIEGRILVGGASSGAIVASAYALGLSSREFRDLLGFFRTHMKPDLLMRGTRDDLLRSAVVDPDAILRSIPNDPALRALFSGDLSLPQSNLPISLRHLGRAMDDTLNRVDWSRGINSGKPIIYVATESDEIHRLGMSVGEFLILGLRNLLDLNLTETQVNQAMHQLFDIFHPSYMTNDQDVYYSLLQRLPEKESRRVTLLKSGPEMREGAFASACIPAFMTPGYHHPQFDAAWSVAMPHRAVLAGQKNTHLLAMTDTQNGVIYENGTIQMQAVVMPAVRILKTWRRFCAAIGDKDKVAKINERLALMKRYPGIAPITQTQLQEENPDVHVRIFGRHPEFPYGGHPHHNKLLRTIADIVNKGLQDVTRFVEPRDGRWELLKRLGELEGDVMLKAVLQTIPA